MCWKTLPFQLIKLVWASPWARLHFNLARFQNKKQRYPDGISCLGVAWLLKPFYANVAELGISLYASHKCCWLLGMFGEAQEGTITHEIHFLLHRNTKATRINNKSMYYLPQARTHKHKLYVFPITERKDVVITSDGGRSRRHYVGWLSLAWLKYSRPPTPSDPSPSPLPALKSTSHLSHRHNFSSFHCRLWKIQLNMGFPF